MFLLGLATLSMGSWQQPIPALWLDLKGEILVDGREVDPQFNPGANKIVTRQGVAYNFTGHKSGILFGDNPALRLGGSITVATWLFPRSYVNDGPGAQILFRGDDRCGYDPYVLVLEGDGTVDFTIQNEFDLGMKIKAEIPLNRWTHVTANFDERSGEMTMWLNGEKFAYARTSKREFVNLDPKFAPGVGVGNVQNDKGPHNQPFNGMIADLRLYSAVLTPEEVGYDGPHSIDPVSLLFGDSGLSALALKPPAPCGKVSAPLRTGPVR